MELICINGKRDSGTKFTGYQFWWQMVHIFHDFGLALLPVVLGDFICDVTCQVENSLSAAHSGSANWAVDEAASGWVALS